MADVDITSLSVEISAESSGAELNIDKLATAISNLRTKANVGSICTALDTLSTSIENLKTSSKGMNGLTSLTKKLNALSQTGDISHVADGINSLKSSLSGMNITQQAKDLGTLQRALSALPAATTSLGSAGLGNLEPKINKLVSAIKPLSNIDTSGIKALNSSVNALGKVPDLTKKLDAKVVDEFSTACQKISDALAPLASQLDKVGNAFAKLPPQLSKVVTQTNRVVAANQKAGKSYLSLSSQMNSFMKRAAQLVSLKAIANYIGNAVVKFNDYYEAANLFGVSMKGLTSETSDFISKMETLLGIDPTEAMNNMATIQSLTTSFGMASDKAYVLSKNLTQLGYDLASLKNIPVAESFTKIQAAISGELEPIRRLGVDLSQARLQQELYALGVNKSVSTLSQADKAVLRYIAIMKQTTDAQGDFARTIGSPANQIKILKAQLEGLARAVGSILYPALSSILPPLIAAVELVKELVQWIANLMGVKVEFPDFSGASADVGGVSDALDNATGSTKKAAKALKNYVMGFDELNVIQKDKDSSGGSGSGSGATGNILGDVDLSGYDMFKDYVGSSVDEIKEKIRSMLPVIEAVAGAFALWELGKFIKQIDEVLSGMNGIQKAALLIATLVVEWTLVQKFSDDFLKTGDTTKLFSEWLTTVAAAIGGYALFGAEGASLAFVVSSVAQLESIKTNLAEGKVKATDASVWMQAISSAIGVSIAGAIFTKTATGFTLGLSVGAVLALTTIAYGGTKGGSIKPGDSIDALLTALIAAAGGIAGVSLALALGASAPVAGAALVLGVGVGVVLEQLGITFGEKDRIKDVEKYIKDYEDKGYTTLAIHYRLQNLGFSDDEINMADQGIDSTFEILRYTFNEKMEKLGAWLDEKIKGFSENWHTSWDSLKTAVGDLSDSLDEKTRKVIESINSGLEGARQKIDEKVAPFAESFRNWVDGLSAENAEAKLKEIGDNISTKFDSFASSVSKKKADAIAAMGEWIEGLKSGVTEKIESVKSKVGEIISAVEDKFKNFSLFDIGKNLIQGLINGINDMITAVTTKVGDVATGILNKAKEVLGINSPSKEFYDIGVYVDQGLANGILLSQKVAQKAMQSLTGAIKEEGRELADESYGLGTISFGISDTSVSKNVGNVIQKSVSGSVKSVQNAFSRLNSTLSDWFKKMKSGFSEFSENVDNVSKFGQDISKGFTDAVNSMSNVSKSILNVKNAFSNTVGSLKSFIQSSISKAENSYNYSGGGFKGILSAIGSVLGGAIDSIPAIVENFGTIISSIETAVSSLKKLIPALGSAKDFIINLVVANPKLAMIAGALSGVVSVLAAAWNSSEKLRNSAKKLFDTLNESASKIFNSLKDAFSPITEGETKDSFDSLEDSVTGVFRTIGDAISHVVDFLTPVVETVTGMILEIMPIIKKVVSYIGKLLTPVIKGIASVIDAIAESLGTIFESVSTALSPAFESILGAVSSIFSVVATIVMQVVTALSPVVSVIANVIGTVFTVVGKLVSSISTALSPVITVIAEVVGNILSIASEIFSVVAELLKPVIEFVGEILSGIFTVVGSIIESVLNLLKPAIDLISDAISGIGDILKGIYNFFIPMINLMIGCVEGFVNAWIKGINFIIRSLNKISFNAPDWVPIIGGKKFGFNFSEVNEISLARVQALATGGMPDSGQIFIARESGPEMVGKMGSSNAVANNDQIVDGIREGVEDAMRQQNELLRRQNELLQALLDKDDNSEISVSSFFQAVNRTNQRAGKSIIPVGT